jgi:hypothetical protein
VEDYRQDRLRLFRTTRRRVAPWRCSLCAASLSGTRRLEVRWRDVALDEAKHVPTLHNLSRRFRIERLSSSMRKEPKGPHTQRRKFPRRDRCISNARRTAAEIPARGIADVEPLPRGTKRAIYSTRPKSGGVYFGRNNPFRRGPDASRARGTLGPKTLETRETKRCPTEQQTVGNWNQTHSAPGHHLPVRPCSPQSATD